MKCNGCLKERKTKPFINYNGQKCQLCNSCFRNAQKLIKNILDITSYFSKRRKETQ